MTPQPIETTAAVAAGVLAAISAALFVAALRLFGRDR